MTRGRPRILALALGVSAAAAPLSAASVRIWVCDSAAEFSLGEARGISVAADGTLLPGRSLSKVEGVSEAVLFAGTPGKKGELYVGTGDSGKVLRVAGDGTVETLATLPEQEVTALAVAPDGTLYAGGSPGGKVYRIEKGKPVLHYDTKAEYVWALAFSGPVLYVGTGLPGEIHRVKGPGQGERVYSTTDPHVRALFADRQGRVWAGTSGSGLVLRIDPAGRVSTVYDSGKPEVTSISADSSGRVWAAAGAADLSSSGGEPISVPVASGSTKPSKSGSPADDEDRSRPEVTVSVSAPRIAPARGSSRGGYSSEVVLFEEGEPPRAVWTSAEEIVFDLAADPDGTGVVAATGPRGKLYAIQTDASSLVRTFDEKQATFLAGADVGLNASSALYRRRAGAAAGEYVSPVKDTGRSSRFGAFRWEGEAPGDSKVGFAFRSGESATPDATWSPWSSWSGSSRTLKIGAPDGRFLQWKLRMEPDGEKVPRVRRVEAAYRNRNAAPMIESLVALEPAEVLARSGTSGSNVYETSATDEKGIFTGLEEAKSEGSPRKLFRKGYRTLQWKATDPDGDSLLYSLEFRPAGSQKWILLKKDIHDTSYSFDSTSLPDGEYVFRVTASDAESNPGEGKTASRDSSPVRIDNTPPGIREVSRSPGTLEITAFDAASPIAEVEFSVDAKKWTRLEPKDGLSDSLEESYTIRLPAEARGAYLLVRVTDAARNVAVVPFTAP
ncbi:MAG: two-component regulator propeller domain-containing protein [Thermoanaerobaculia bacterium]